MLDRYDQSDFEYEGLIRRVFCRGEGPGIIVMTEGPGIYDAVVEFADRLVDAGYRVYLPDLIGEAGRPFSNGRTIIWIKCLRRFKLRLLCCSNSWPRVSHEMISGPWRC